MTISDKQNNGCGRRGSGPAGQSAFTMIEIALCLAIIGFALVAIIGVLPTGMGVQRQNREETIINQDATIWMDAIRNGAQGYDDLTNYVVSITVSSTDMDVSGASTNASGTVTTVYVPNIASAFPLTNGGSIIGLLSTPKYIPQPKAPNDLSFRSNYVSANIRAISGSAVEKFPQKNAELLESAFQYRLVVENTPVPTVPPVGTNGAPVWENFNRNSRDLRLFFRWPVIPTGAGSAGTGNERQTFRTMIGGQVLTVTNKGQLLYFFQPSTYVAQ